MLPNHRIHSSCSGNMSVTSAQFRSQLVQICNVVVSRDRLRFASVLVLIVEVRDLHVTATTMTSYVTTT